jgi:DNA (cytosine-5)-methyltransferase 1
MRYGSVCSGIEAASVAWHPLGWEAQWFSEIENFPSAVLAHRFPNVPNLGDMTKIHEHEKFKQSTIDVLVGGTPCQSFSVAGLRKGLDDPRGNLMLTFLAIAGRKRPRWVVWENVPGVLSSNEGRDFGTFLSGLAELGYGFAYRILDAQYFGVAQRRRRVFVVGYLGDWRPAAAVLFERHSLSGHPAPRREKREGTAGSFENGFDDGIPELSNALCARDYKGPRPEADQGAPIVIDRAAFNQGEGAQYDPYITESEVMPSLVARGPHAVQQIAIRRLTPVECERLQGFPDSWTQIPYRNKPADQCPDGPRYKACGNSMAVPVMRWIGERINLVNSIL